VRFGSILEWRRREAIGIDLARRLAGGSEEEDRNVSP
jgi:hypothetical protein